MTRTAHFIDINAGVVRFERSAPPTPTQAPHTSRTASSGTPTPQAREGSNVTLTARDLADARGLLRSMGISADEAKVRRFAQAMKDERQRFEIEDK